MKICLSFFLWTSFFYIFLIYSFYFYSSIAFFFLFNITWLYIHIPLLISLEYHLLNLHLVEYVVGLHSLRKRHDLISHEAIHSS